MLVGGSALVQTGILFSDLGFYLDQAEQSFDLFVFQDLLDRIDFNDLLHDLFYFVNNNEVYGVIHDLIPGIIHGVTWHISCYYNGVI